MDNEFDKDIIENNEENIDISDENAETNEQEENIVDNESNETDIDKESNEQEEEKDKTQPSEWLHIFVLAFTFVFIIISLFFRIARVDGTSMYPTLDEGQPLIISNFLYTPKQGDIVVVQQSNLETRYLSYPIVKRVIATSGQKVEIDFKNWKVTVDGVVLEEEYINRVAGSMSRLDMSDNTFVVPDGYIFVMGDNRNGSTDSRNSKIGFLREDEVVGKVILRIFPFTIF